MAVRIKDSDRIELAKGEEPHDQQLSIFVDENLKGPILLDSVLNEEDMISRCPVDGTIDFTNELGGDSIKALLEDLPDVTEDIEIDPNGEGVETYGKAYSDRFAVSDAKWLKNKKSLEMLIWKSAILAQIKAKLNAIDYFKSSAIDLNKIVSEEEKAMVAERARELSKDLIDLALAELQNKNTEAINARKESRKKTEDYLDRFCVTDKEAIEKGGLTKTEVKGLFKGGDE